MTEHTPYWFHSEHSLQLATETCYHIDVLDAIPSFTLLCMSDVLGIYTILGHIWYA